MQILKSLFYDKNESFDLKDFYAALQKGGLCYFKEFELSGQSYAKDFISALKKELENKPFLKKSKSIFICFCADINMEFEELCLALDALKMLGDVEVFFATDTEQNTLKASIVLTGIEI